MATHPRRLASPAPVPVIRFEKRRSALAETRESEIEDTMTEPGLPLFEEAPGAEGSAARAAGKPRVILNGKPYRPTVSLTGAPVVPRAPARVPRHPGVEAFEYHRRRVEADAARGDGAARRAAELALVGYGLLGRGEAREARVVFESLVAGEPPQSFPYTILGALYQAEGDEAHALALYDAALSLDRGDVAARVSRGEIRLRRGQYKEALKDLERALSAPAAGPEVFSNRARGLVGLARTLRGALR